MLPPLQATSAEHAVRLLGALVEEHGAAEALGVLFADSGGAGGRPSPPSAWYFESASGHHWLARRVPDGAFFVSGNQVR